jgi:hypothetical protein
MTELPGALIGARRDEDVALDLMKFIAMTTGYGGKSAGSTPGFQSGGAKGGPEDHADQLLKLYSRCLDTVKARK